MSSPTIDQEIAMIEEVNCAIYLIEFGLIALNRVSNAEHLPILLLSNGFERLLKMVICLDFLKHKGQFPDTSTFKKTHNVDQLRDRVNDIVKKWEYAEKCATAREDINFLQNDGDLKELVGILTKYGKPKGGRYYNIDVVIGEENIGNDPIQLFDSYCTQVSRRQPNSQKKTTGVTPEEKIDESVRYVNRQITMLSQRFARALCRMFIWGNLGQIGQDIANIVEDFLCLRDEDLGKVKLRWFQS